MALRVSLHHRLENHGRVNISGRKIFGQSELKSKGKTKKEPNTSLENFFMQKYDIKRYVFLPVLIVKEPQSLP